MSATGQLYGSVGAAQVADALEAKGLEVDRKIITMRDAKRLGEYEAVIHFYKDVEVKIPVTVVAESAEVLAPAKEEEVAPVAEVADDIEEDFDLDEEEEAPAAE